MINIEKIKNALKNINIEDENTIHIRVSYQLEKQGYKILEKHKLIEINTFGQEGKTKIPRTKIITGYKYLISENGTESCLIV